MYFYIVTNKQCNMKEINEEQKTKNLSVFVRKLEQLGIDSKKLLSEIEDKILNASVTTSLDSGLAFDGSLLHFIVRIVTPIALKINEALDEKVQVDKDSLIKVCLLHQISKTYRVIKNENAWETKNLGRMYKYSKTDYSLRTGSESLWFCMKNGVSFNERECEAMLVLDKDPSDKQSYYYTSTLAMIIRQANELGYMQESLIQ